MGKEIERKFLVNPEKWKALEKPEPRLYRQGYFTTNPGKSIRIRNSGKKSYLTIKSEVAEMTRSEFEYEIPNDDAQELLDKFCDAELQKYRYNIYYNNKKWEVDVFLNENQGLIIAEIELLNPDENVVLPNWVDGEVTGVEKYYNARLVDKPFTRW